jgi:hypothetical protein
VLGEQNRLFATVPNGTISQSPFASTETLVINKETQVSNLSISGWIFLLGFTDQNIPSEAAFIRRALAPPLT